MRLFGNFILRFIVIVIGFILAVAAAGLFVGIGFFNEAIISDPPVEIWEQDFLRLISIGFGFVSAILIGAYSYGVVAAIIALAETMRWSGLVANLVMGGVVAAFLALTNLGGSSGENVSDGALLVSLSAGFIGGFVYWVIAGRSAGKWLGPTSAPSSKF